MSSNQAGAAQAVRVPPLRSAPGPLLLMLMLPMPLPLPMPW